MKKPPLSGLSRRERQIMDIVFQKGEASASEILKSMDDPPSNSSVRTILRVLESKGYLKHIERDLKYIYLPAVSPEKAKQSALSHVIETFFNGSPSHVVAAILDDADLDMTEEELERIEALVRKAKREGK